MSWRNVHDILLSVEKQLTGEHVFYEVFRLKYMHVHATYAIISDNNSYLMAPVAPVDTYIY